MDSSFLKKYVDYLLACEYEKARDIIVSETSLEESLRYSSLLNIQKKIYTLSLVNESAEEDTIENIPKSDLSSYQIIWKSSLYIYQLLKFFINDSFKSDWWNTINIDISTNMNHSITSFYMRYFHDFNQLVELLKELSTIEDLYKELAERNYITLHVLYHVIFYHSSVCLYSYPMAITSLNALEKLSIQMNTFISPPLFQILLQLIHIIKNHFYLFFYSFFRSMLNQDENHHVPKVAEKLIQLYSNPIYNDKDTVLFILKSNKLYTKEQAIYGSPCFSMNDIIGEDISYPLGLSQWIYTYIYPSITDIQDKPYWPTICMIVKDIESSNNKRFSLYDDIFKKMIFSSKIDDNFYLFLVTSKTAAPDLFYSSASELQENVNYKDFISLQKQFISK
ncbi:hypothetical protein WA158_006885 [Blastocystis sp. Blastoise]